MWCYHRPQQITTGFEFISAAQTAVIFVVFVFLNEQMIIALARICCRLFSSGLQIHFWFDWGRRKWNGIKRQKHFWDFEPLAVDTIGRLHSVNVSVTFLQLLRFQEKITRMSRVADSGREQENEGAECTVNLNAPATCPILCSSNSEV